MKTFRSYLQNEKVQFFLLICVVVGVLSLVYSAGLRKGEQRARVKSNYADFFEHSFIGPDPHYKKMPKPGFPGEHLIPPFKNGSAGVIVQIDGLSIVVADDEHLEKVILLDDHSLIREFDRELATTDLKLGDRIVAFGKMQENGSLTAYLVRRLPEPRFDQMSWDFNEKQK